MSDRWPAIGARPDRRRGTEDRRRGLFAPVSGSQGFEQSFDFADAARETPEETQDRDLERAENPGKDKDCNEFGSHEPDLSIIQTKTNRYSAASGGGGMVHRKTSPRTAAPAATASARV